MTSQNLEDCVFDFDRQGEGGFLRAPMTNKDGKINRTLMVSRGEKFIVVATLMDVVHGKMKDGGDDATLLIACFRFKPSGKNRFKNANITWTFTSDDPAVQVDVVGAAPEDRWALDPVTEKLERNWSVNASAGPNIPPVSATAGAQYGGKKGKDIVRHTTVDGTILALERDDGECDSIRWSLAENEANPDGICRMFVAGVLVKRTIKPGMTPRPGPTPIFLGAIDIHADKHVQSGLKTWTEKVFKDTYKDEAVRFQPGTDKESGQFEINKNNLQAINLAEDIMYMSIHENFEELRKRKEDRKQKKREEAQKQKHQDEEKKEKEKDEKKSKHEDEKKKQQEGKKSTVPPTPAITTPVDPTQSRGQDTSPITQPPTWLYYVVLGMLGMFFWQQLNKLLFGGK